MANENPRIRYTKEQVEAAFNKGVEQFEEDQAQAAEKLKVEAEAKRKEELKKKAVLPPPKYYYDVKVECMLPAVLTYRVLAENPHQAAELIKGKSPNSVQHKLVGRKELILKVYDASGSMMRFMKKLLG